MLRFLFLSQSGRLSILLVPFLLLTSWVHAQTVNMTINSGAKVIDMGQSPQTIANSIKAYGLVYELVNVHQVPVRWVINPTKIKDGIDFSHNGINYYGGPFVIEPEYLSAGVLSSISTWQAKGVVVNTTVSAINVPVALISVRLKKRQFV